MMFLLKNLMNYLLQKFAVNKENNNLTGYSLINGVDK